MIFPSEKYLGFSQKNHTKEELYISLIKKLMNNQLFKTLWQQVQLKKTVRVFQNFSKKRAVNSKDHLKRLEFFWETMIRHSRFYLNMQIRANQETFEYFHQAQSKTTK